MQLSTVRRGPVPVAVALVLSLRALSAQGPGLTDLPVLKLDQMADAPPLLASQPVLQLSGDAELDGPRTLSVTFARALPIRDVLLLLVRDTAFSTVVDASVQGTFSGELRDLTIRQALEAVLVPAGLDYDVRATVIRVFPRRPLTRLFQLDLLAVRRSWRSRLEADPGAVVSAVDSDVFGDIERGVAALLSRDGQHHVDRRAGLVQVTDFADRLDQVAVYLETVQLRATRQVRIDVRILRLARIANPSGPGARRPPVIATDPAEILAALRRSGALEVVASPTLMTMNNEPAMVRLSEAAMARGGDGRPAELQSLSLVVTPQISADGFVHLSIVPTLTGRAATVIESDSIVRLRLGQTILLPALPDGYEGVEEWLLLLTPEIVNPGSSFVTDEASRPGGASPVQLPSEASRP